jgi:hypothetical protein
VVKPVKAELVKTVLIDEKGCKKGAKSPLFGFREIGAALLE